jgi:ABC-type nitrate/sulfonate/bicarbonate transport system substrate-binding protein
MSNGHSRPTETNLGLWRTGLAVVMSAILFLTATPTVCAAETFSGNAVPVRLQLKWRHQFQFAGFYTALEKGYYHEAGFDVTIIPATPGTDPVEIVLKGGADFGVASSELVLRYARGDPVVVLASIFQHSPLTLFVRRDAGIDTVHDLAGHKVALAPWETEIFAYLRREQVASSMLFFHPP